jgi:ribokinase
MNKTIAVVGDCSTDHFLVMGTKDVGIIHPDTNKQKICFAYGEKIPVKDVYKSFGGSALNVATSLSNFPISVELVGFVGRDFEGRETIGHLHSQRIGSDHVIIDQTTNQSFIIVFDDERTVLSNHLERNYSRLKIPKTDFIYLASCGEGSEDMINDLKAAIAKGSRLIFNPGNFILRNFDFFKSLLQNTAVLILNREEADELFRANKVVDQLAKILALGTKLAVITDGKNGAYFAVADQYYHMHADVSEVLDPTGAGDAFAGALVAGIIQGVSLEESARWGMINSSAVIKQFGATEGALDVSQIEKMSANNKILKFSPL